MGAYWRLLGALGWHVGALREGVLGRPVGDFGAYKRVTWGIDGRTKSDQPKTFLNIPKSTKRRRRPPPAHALFNNGHSLTKAFRHPHLPPLAPASNQPAPNSLKTRPGRPKFVPSNPQDIPRNPLPLRYCAEQRRRLSDIRGGPNLLNKSTEFVEKMGFTYRGYDHRGYGISGIRLDFLDFYQGYGATGFSTSNCMS